MFNKLVIVSDDLTGAADCSSRCSTLEINCRVYLSVPEMDLQEEGVVAINTDSRFLPGKEAKERVIKLLSPFAKSDNIVWYKKIDSTLRGNIGEELEALVETVFSKDNKPLIILSSSFPAQNRGLNKGYLFSPTTGFAKTYLPDIIKKQSNFKVGMIGVGNIRLHQDKVASYLQEEIDKGTELLIADSLLECDLAALTKASAEIKNKNILFCGSAGLVVHLARHLLDTGVLTKREVSDKYNLDKKSIVLGVIGSGSLNAHKQIDFLSEKSTTIVKKFENETTEKELVSIESTVNILLHLPEPEDRNLDTPLAREFAKPLINLAYNFITKNKITKLIVSGGDTSSLLLSRLGIEKLTIIKEIFPGMPLCLGISNSGEQYYVILKSGNHGEENTLVFLFNFLSSATGRL